MRFPAGIGAEPCASVRHILGRFNPAHAVYVAGAFDEDLLDLRLHHTLCPRKRRQ